MITDVHSSPALQSESCQGVDWFSTVKEPFDFRQLRTMIRRCAPPSIMSMALIMMDFPVPVSCQYRHSFQNLRNLFDNGKFLT